MNLADKAESDIAKERKMLLVVRLLGYGGLLPFLFLAAAVLLGLRAPFATASALLMGYGAIILSFVGALHWGVQLVQKQPSPARFIWSVVPALTSWLALMMPIPIGTGLVIFGLLSCLAYDWRVLASGEWPAYMRPLRLILTLVACLCLSVNILFVVV